LHRATDGFSSLVPEAFKEKIPHLLLLSQPNMPTVAVTSTKRSISNTSIKIYYLYKTSNFRFSPQGTLNGMEIQQRPWDLSPAVV